VYGINSRNIDPESDTVLSTVITIQNKQVPALKEIIAQGRMRKKIQSP
jgi:hypothetical protein